MVLFIIFVQKNGSVAKILKKIIISVIISVD